MIRLPNCLELILCSHHNGRQENPRRHVFSKKKSISYSLAGTQTETPRVQTKCSSYFLSTADQLTAMTAEKNLFETNFC